jgi:hypothetical protein
MNGWNDDGKKKTFLLHLARITSNDLLSISSLRLFIPRVPPPRTFLSLIPIFTDFDVIFSYTACSDVGLVFWGQFGISLSDVRQKEGFM